jgi:hypothetical protein
MKVDIFRGTKNIFSSKSNENIDSKRVIVTKKKIEKFFTHPNTFFQVFQ